MIYLWIFLGLAAGEIFISSPMRYWYSKKPGNEVFNVAWERVVAYGIFALAAFVVTSLYG
jgi:hypothetical protein